MLPTGIFPFNLLFNFMIGLFIAISFYDLLLYVLPFLWKGEWISVNFLKFITYMQYKRHKIIQTKLGEVSIVIEESLNLKK